MKRKLYVIIMSFFAITYIATVLLLPYYNPVYFYIQHISLFLFMGMFVFYILKLIYLKLELRVKNTSYLKVYTVFTFGLLMFVFSEVQLWGIEMYQTPGFESCAYYDQYNNAIYYTQLPNECPELNIIQNTDSTLKFTATERMDGILDADYLHFDAYGYKYEGLLRTSVAISYDLLGRITMVDIASAISIRMYNEVEEEQLFGSRTINIVNEYDISGDFDLVQFRQTKTTNNILTNPIDITEKVVTVDIYETKKIKDLNPSEDTYQLIITAERFEDGEKQDLELTNDIYRVLHVDETDKENILIEHGTFNGIVTTSVPPIYGMDNKATIRYNDEITHEYYMYHYSDEENETAFITYKKWKDYGPVITETGTPFYSYGDTDQLQTTRYRGIDYAEMGNKYMKLYKEDYGMKIVNVSLQDGETDKEFEATTYPFSFLLIPKYNALVNTGTQYDVLNMFDYKSKFLVINEHDDFLYQYNPLIHSVVDVKK